MTTFKENLKSSLKSSDTEETLDLYFTRPIGLAFALLWNKLGIHPNVITVLSIFLGVASAFMFYHTDFYHNLCGIFLLMFANFCDSTDGQMARLTGKKTLIGRILDGLAGNTWFVSIYIALCLRMQTQMIPGITQCWGIWIWVLGVLAGILSHSPQSSLSDYYRQVHLFFLKGKQGSELDNSVQQTLISNEARQNNEWIKMLFFKNYANYCKSQEKRTPQFQLLYHKIITLFSGDVSRMPQDIRSYFLAGSRPLMKYTNIMTFNCRAILIYITALLDKPWIYFILEITFFNIMYFYMRSRHEGLSKASYLALCEQERNSFEAGQR